MWEDLWEARDREEEEREDMEDGGGGQGGGSKAALSEESIEWVDEPRVEHPSIFRPFLSKKKYSG